MTTIRRVAALADIHGNLPALEAVLADVERESVDAIVVAGDSSGGPWPAEVVDLPAALDPILVRGNADRLDAVRDFDDALGTWNAQRLGPSRLAASSECPVTAELEVAGLGSVVVCHATPTDDEPISTRITPDDELMGAPVRPELLRYLFDPPTSDETTVYFESLRGA